MAHKPFSELVKQMSPKAQKRSRNLTRQILAEMELSELHEALKIRQTDLARRLRTTQAAISRLEARPDTKISTLQNYVEALGGELEVRANLPDRTIRLTHFMRRLKTRGTVSKRVSTARKGRPPRHAR